MSEDVADLPSIQTLCIEAAASADFWRVQPRHLEALREEHVNSFVNALISRGRLPPTSLYKFRSTSLTEIAVARYKSADVDRWIGGISHLHYLRSINILVSSSLKTRWHSLPTWSALASTLQSLTLTLEKEPKKSRRSLSRALESTIPSLTSLTELKLIDTTLEYRENERGFDVDLKDLEPLSSLVKLELTVDFGDPESMSSLVRLTNLESISIDVYDVSHKAESYDYAPGVLYLGSLPKLERFEFTGPLSCPPVGRKLTSLFWRPRLMEPNLDEAAELAWIKMEPKLESLREFKFNCHDEERKGVVTIVKNIVAGAASSLTSLHLEPRTMKCHDNFLSTCTNLKSLAILDSIYDWKDYENHPVYHLSKFQSLPTFTNLTKLQFNYEVAGCDLVNAVQSIRCLTNLERLDLVPWTLTATRELARGGVLRKIKHLCMVLRDLRDEPLPNNFDDLLEESKEAVRGAKESFQHGFPSLKKLCMEENTRCFHRYFAFPEKVWQILASMAPDVDYIAIEGIAVWESGATKVSDVRFENNRIVAGPQNEGISKQMQYIAQVFNNLKRLELGWKFSQSDYKPRCALGPAEIAKAKTAPGDLTFEELERESKQRLAKEARNIVHAEYLEPLSAEVLKYDERCRYTNEEMEAVGERWKNSVQGKKEIMELRSKLADDALVL